jgi:hypothetical protein
VLAKNIKGRKFVATAATAALVASAIVPVASAAEFSDASKIADWAKEHVEYAKTNGLLSGNADGTFNPEGNFSRAQAAQVIVNYLGLDTKNTTAQFSDVSADEWYYGVVNAAKVAGKVDGIGDGKFDPEGNLSRQDAAKLFGSLLNLDPTKADKKVLDQFNDKASIADYADEYVAIFVAAGAINGKGEGFDPTGLITRQELAKIISLAVQADKAGKLDAYKVVEEVSKVAVKSVTAINATTVEVKFDNALPSTTDFNNFEINGGLVVTDAVISSDRKTATLTTNRDLTRNQEYTVTVTGFKNAEGQDVADATGKFTWEVAEGVVVALEATSLEQGQVIGLTVKDAAGKDVKDASVTVRSYNDNLVAVTSGTAGDAPDAFKLTAQPLAGSTDVEVITSLADGTVLTNTFKVTVKEAVTTVANKGYTLLSATPTSYAYDNTAAFSKFATANTSVEVGDTAVLYAFGETNGTPDAAPIDFTGATVKTSNGLVATAVVNPTTNELEVTGQGKGTATLTVTLNDTAKTKKTFAITVTEEPVFKEISVDATSIKLSDETKSTSDEEGVNQATVTVTSLDQFKDEINFPATGKVTVTTSTTGLVLGGLVADATTSLVNNLDFSVSGDEAEFTVTSTKDTPITGGKVTVSYFAKATDTKPTATKVITVNVVDVDATVNASDLDVIVPYTEIDANAQNTRSGADTDNIDFTQSVAYQLDAKGNRIGLTSITGATLATASQADKFVGIDSDVLIFSLDGGTTDDTQKVLSFGRAISGTVTVNVTDGTITKPVAVKYKNSAVLPGKATVATSPITVKIPAASSISIEDLIFGAIDSLNADGQLLEDAISSTTLAGSNGVYAIAKSAKNAGYIYNKPVVSITGTDGKPFAIGTGLYGLDLATEAKGNVWYNGFAKDITTLDYLTAGGFGVEFSITNVVKSAGATVDNTGTLTDEVTLAATTDYATFTLLIKGIYVDAAPYSTPEEKAANNLLAAPAQINVSVSAK